MKKNLRHWQRKTTSACPKEIHSHLSDFENISDANI